MNVKFFNGFYFLFIIIAIIICLSLYFILRNKTKKTKYIILLVIAFLNLGLHFAKLMFSPYKEDLPYSIRKVTGENICAFTTIVIPFILLFRKGEIIKNYFFFISFFGGLGALLVPTEALGKYPFTFDIIRFYLCHTVLLIIPILLSALDLFRPNLKVLIYMPLMFIIVETLIFLNEFILYKVGYISQDLTSFFSANERNSSLIFGPIKEMKSFEFIFRVFVPDIFKINFFNFPVDGTFYMPVIWLIIPAYIYISLGYFVICLIFNNKETRIILKKEKKI